MKFKYYDVNQYTKQVLPGFEVLIHLNKSEFDNVLDYLKSIEIKDSFDKISSDINDLSGKNSMVSNYSKPY